MGQVKGRDEAILLSMLHDTAIVSTATQEVEQVFKKLEENGGRYPQLDEDKVKAFNEISKVVITTGRIEGCSASDIP